MFGYWRCWDFCYFCFDKFRTFFEIFGICSVAVGAFRVLFNFILAVSSLMLTGTLQAAWFLATTQVWMAKFLTVITNTAQECEPIRFYLHYYVKEHMFVEECFVGRIPKMGYPSGQLHKMWVRYRTRYCYLLAATPNAIEVARFWSRVMQSKHSNY